MQRNEHIKVWDLFVRISHWSLVAFVFISFLSGDEKSIMHIYSGYMVLGIITLRFVWGFIGGRHARFADFMYPPGQAIQYLKELTQGTPRHYVGHNPAAGWMVICLLVALAAVCFTGHMTYKFKEQGVSAQHPAIIKNAHADNDDDEDEDREHHGESEENQFWEEMHEGTALILSILIILHISGALVSSKVHRENLVKAMITGNKEKKDEQSSIQGQ